jgi:hypothetical protein
MFLGGGSVRRPKPKMRLQSVRDKQLNASPQCASANQPTGSKPAPRRSLMTLLDSVTNVLKQYTSGSTPDAANASEHFDQVAQTASPNALAEGLSAMFKSEQTPAFGNMVCSLFVQSNG